MHAILLALNALKKKKQKKKKMYFTVYSIATYLDIFTHVQLYISNFQVLSNTNTQPLVNLIYISDFRGFIFFKVELLEVFDPIKYDCQQLSCSVLPLWGDDQV